MKLVYAIVVAVLVGCAGGIPVHNKPDDTASCAGACAKLNELGCPEGKPLQPDKEHPKGQSCVEFCEYTQDNGHALNPSCVVKIEKCSDLEPLCQRRTK
jgi:hypothetical protein